MLCTRALFSLPVEQAQVQVVEGGTREGGGTSMSSSNSSNSSSNSSSTVTQSKIVGTTMAQIYLGRGDRFLQCVGYYRPTVRGYAADAPVAGGKSDGLGSPTETNTTWSEGGMLQKPQAG